MQVEEDHTDDVLVHLYLSYYEEVVIYRGSTPSIFLNLLIYCANAFISHPLLSLLYMSTYP